MATTTHRVSTASTSNASSYVSGSFTPALNDLLVAFVSASGTAAAAPTLTGSTGLTFTLVLSVARNASADRIYVFVANALATAVAQTVTFDCSEDAATGAVIQVASVAGVTRTGSGAVRQSASTANAAAAGTPAATFPAAALTANPTLGCVSNGASPATLTPPTNWTEANDTGYSTPTTGAEYVFRDSGFTGTTVTWGGTSATAFGVALIELDTSTPAITGTAAGTVAPVLGAASAQSLVQGAATRTLDAVLGAGQAGVLAQAQGAAVLAPVLGAGSASVTSPAITGAGAAVLGPIVGSGTAQAQVVAAGSGVLSPVLGAGSAQVPVSAQGASVLAPVVGAGTASVPISGAGAGMLDAMVGEGAVAVPVSGASSVTLDPVLGAGDAVIGSPPIIGQGSSLLSPVLGTGAATVFVRGAGGGLLGGVYGMGQGSVTSPPAPAGPFAPAPAGRTALTRPASRVARSSSSSSRR